MEEIFDLVKEIALKINRAIEIGESGYSEFTNDTGDRQLKLDILSDEIIERELSKSRLIKSIISEEKEGEVELNSNGEFTICYDPLDGSSIVEFNLSVGSIFGIYRGGLDGKDIVGAIYVVYGPRLEIIKSIKGAGTRLYRFENGEFIDRGEVKMDSKGKINAPGGTQKNWLSHHKKLVESLFMDGYRLRYSGGMVPDLHQILLKGGGLFSYPATTDKPKGKLRSLFEVIPFALVFTESGGYAIDDNGKSLLDITPTKIHDTTPCFFGSEFEIERVKEFYGSKK
jgi:fructose-1,6-bisphosphatase I